MIKLGQEVKDIVSGFRGIAVCRSEFLNGCIRYTVQAKVTKKDGSMPDERWFDEKQLEVSGKGVYVEPKRTGGPTSSVVPKGYRG